MVFIRIINVDFYISPPIQSLDVMYSEFRSSAVHHVPIIRIFGSLDNGKKICLHVHGVFPYIYIPYDGNENVEGILYQTAIALDKSLNVLLGQSSSNAQHVYKIVLVSGRPLYGYHKKEHQFLKIYFYNPLIIKKAVTLLENGSIMGKFFQPHEAHLPYILQFMIDCNLHGMSFIKLSDIRFRVNSTTEADSEVYIPENINKVSTCELEGDVTVEQILNRLEIKEGKLGSNPGIVALWEDEKQRRRNKNVNSQISQCLSQNKRECSVTASHLLLKQTLQEKLSGSSKHPEQSALSVDKNLSVYPAETPDSEDILNASSILSQSSLEITSTVSNESKHETESIDMLDLLCEMAEQEAAEEGSILSQVVKNPEESDGENGEADLSLPLSPIEFESIPQLDGSADIETEIQTKRGLDMPILENVHYGKKLFFFSGKSCKLNLKERIITKRKNSKSVKAVKTYFSLVKKQLPKVDILKLIAEIKNECILRRIQKSKKVKFRTIPSIRHLHLFSSMETAKVIFPTLNSSYYIPIPPMNRKQFTYEEIANSKYFPLLQDEFVCVPVEKKNVKEHKDLLAGINIKPFSKCSRSNCSVLKRYLRQIINDYSKINVDEIKAKLKNFSCCVSELFDNKAPEKEQKSRRSVTRKNRVQSTTAVFVSNLCSKESNCETDANSNIKTYEQTKISNSHCTELNKKIVLDENGNITNISSEIPGTCNDAREQYLRKRRYMRIYKEVAKRQMQSLDGANDSSSSENEMDDRKVNYSQRKQKAIYSPLFIDESITEKTNFGCQEKIKEISENRLLCREKTKTDVDCNLKLDETFVEEHLVCRLQQNTSKRTKKLLFQHIEHNTNAPSDGGATKTEETLGKTESHLTSQTHQNTGSSPASSKELFTSTSDSLTPYQKYKIQNVKNKTFETTSDGCYVWVPVSNPPTRAEILDSLQRFDLPEIKHQLPFYSNPEDVTRKIEVGNAVLKVLSNASVHCSPFQSSFNPLNISEVQYKTKKALLMTSNTIVVTPAKEPPTRKEVEKWLIQKAQTKPKETTVKAKKIKVKLPISQEDKELSDDSISISPCSPESTSKTVSEDSSESLSRSGSPVLGKKNKKIKLRRRKACSKDKIHENLRKSIVEAQFLANVTNDCQISAATLNNTHGFKLSLENLQDVLALAEHQHLLTLIMELHVQTRGDFKPDPQFDPIRAIFYGIIHDSPESKLNNTTGVFVVNSLFANFEKTKNVLVGTGVDCNVVYADSETALLNEFVMFLQKCDPDILTGYEIEMASWGYLIERGYSLGLNLPPLLSRIPNIKSSLKNNQKFSEEFNLPGRIVLDMWRLMRHEIALQSYTFENIVYHVLHKRVPFYSHKDLTFWWEHKSCLYRHKTLDFYFLRVKSIIMLIEQLDLIGRTSELARLFGIQFFEVLSRGSQFRVESMMLRLAKPLNYIPVSPSVSQRAKMKAPEYLPLILEPESKFYADPVIVLDFQSLYPSIIIAYNYCFSTCVGRVEHLGKNVPFEFGATQLKISPATIKKLLFKNKLNFSSCGVAFVTSDIRQGILPCMLREILDTRLMVKKSMKQNKDNKTLQRVLHSRQLGLKLIANVTYGYTAANFSGRMPCVELGDSVVSKGRETLQRAIDLIDKTTEWGAKVVYGDTDSIFVLVPGKSRKDAFEIGAKIAEAVTNDNPSPVKLKLEKVYQPCILQTKKRYVGYMYESVEQTEPEFDAKGIETVRRDGCPAASKMLEKCLKMLFDHCDVSLIKKYVLRQFNKILMGRISIQDLTFAKEYRGTSGYRPGACVPALELAKKWKAIDKRNEPRAGQRVPYVVVNGPPGLPLIRLVRSPYELLLEPSLRPNAIYYITRVIIPPINRCFNLIGVDLNTWFHEMPRKQFQYLPKTSPTKKSTISQFFMTTSCTVCGQQSQNGICNNCIVQPQTSVTIMHEKIRVWEQRSTEINLICGSCTGDNLSAACVSLDCPVLYQKNQANIDLQQCSFVRQIIKDSF